MSTFMFLTACNKFQPLSSRYRIASPRLRIDFLVRGSIGAWEISVRIFSLVLFAVDPAAPLSWFFFALLGMIRRSGAASRLVP